MKPHIFTLLLLCALPVLAQQENADVVPDRAARRAERAAYWGRFFSVGYEGGTIAPFGIRGELGGSDKRIGAFLNFRSSLRSTSKLEQYAREDFPANKTEFVGGASLRLTHWAYLNVGGGIGWHHYPFVNEYAHEQTLERKSYIPGYWGATFRLTKLINIVGGMSYIAFTERLYAPEYTFGITINLKQWSVISH
nr:hypothetical protein [uncultured Capnocytophaga sp.]